MADGMPDIVAPPARIAFIGLGNMGRPMARQLAQAGFDVVGFDAAAATRASVAATSGLAVADTLRSAVGDAAAVVTMLPDGKIVSDVVGSLLSHLSRHAVVIDMSSSDPMSTRDLGQDLAAAGFELIDAPVSGGVKRAANGTLAIMVGGRDACVDRVEPILRAMGSSVFRTGALGSGHAIKALNNYVSGAGLAAAVEALKIARHFGLDENTVVDVLNASTGRNNSTELKLKQFVIPETYASGFFLGLMAKDIRTAAKLARDLHVAAPFVDACANLWDGAAVSLGAAADHTEIGRFPAAG